MSEHRFSFGPGFTELSCSAILSAMTSWKRSGRRGPPKAFDVDKALEAAMRVFWQKGFADAALSDLTKAMRINRPSLYATFGNKHALFRKAIVHYVDQGNSSFEDTKKAATARDFVAAVLRRKVDLYTNPSFPQGCFFIQSAMAGAASQPARRAALDARETNEKAILDQLKTYKKPGELPPGFTAAELTAFVVSVGNGIAIRAADGASREALYRIVDISLAFWPAKKSAKKKPQK
jgi:AcrR family transcriptional regulator